MFSRLARTQYKALATMRWRLLTNRMRSYRVRLNWARGACTFMIYCTMGLGLAIGLGGGAYSIASRGRWEFLPIVFWVVFLVWQVIPIALASFQEQFDLSGLLRFPVNFGSFYLLHLVFGLVDVSAILGGLCCFGIWIGITLARPELFLWTALALIDLRRVQRFAGASDSGVDRPVAGATAHAGDCQRRFSAVHVEPAATESSAAPKPQPCSCAIQFGRVRRAAKGDQRSATVDPSHRCSGDLVAARIGIGGVGRREPKKRRLPPCDR